MSDAGEAFTRLQTLLRPPGSQTGHCLEIQAALKSLTDWASAESARHLVGASQEYDQLVKEVGGDRPQKLKLSYSFGEFLVSSHTPPGSWTYPESVTQLAVKLDRAKKDLANEQQRVKAAGQAKFVESESDRNFKLEQAKPKAKEVEDVGADEPLG